MSGLCGCVVVRSCGQCTWVSRTSEGRMILYVYIGTLLYLWVFGHDD